MSENEINYKHKPKKFIYRLIIQSGIGHLLNFGLIIYFLIKIHDFHFELLLIYLALVLNSIRYFFWSRFQLIKFELLKGEISLSYMDFNKLKTFKSPVHDLAIYPDQTFSLGPLSFLVLKSKNKTLRFYALFDFNKTQITDIVNNINQRFPANVFKKGASRQYLNSKFLKQ